MADGTDDDTTTTGDDAVQQDAQQDAQQADPPHPDAQADTGGDGAPDVDEQKTDDLNTRITALESVVSNLSKIVDEMRDAARDDLMDGDDAPDDTTDEDEDGAAMTLADLMA